MQTADVGQAVGRLRVDGMLPFLVPLERARAALRDWVKSRWFAPNEFARRGVDGRFTGIYLPCFTYDAMTHTRYAGERGEHYWVTVGSGQNQRKEMRTRWYTAAGAFSRFFDDVTICAATSVPAKLSIALEPWPFTQVRPFAAELLAGFAAVTYDMPLADGFGRARARIDAAILDEVHRRIGGDTQRVHSLHTQTSAITYKHLMLPVWMLAYRYATKSYQVIVNACTGEVQGERPWSWIKIAFAVLLGAAVAATAGLLFAGQ